jgi:restriction system protein
MFGRLGYEVEQTPPSKDGGKDAILRKDGKKYLLECKKYGERGSSGRPELNGFFGVITANQAVSGFFVTTGAFTKDAIEFAATVPIELIDRAKLVRYMLESKTIPRMIIRPMCRKCCAIVATVAHRNPDVHEWPCRRAHIEH